MWIAIIRAVTLLLGLSIFTFGGTSEKVVEVIKEPVKEVKDTLKTATPLILIGAAIWAWQTFRS